MNVAEVRVHRRLLRRPGGTTVGGLEYYIVVARHPACVGVDKANNTVCAARALVRLPGLATVGACADVVDAALPGCLNIDDVHPVQSALAAFDQRPGLAAICGFVCPALVAGPTREAGVLIQKSGHACGLLDFHL